MMQSPPRTSPAQQLKELLNRKDLLIVPACYDPMSARLVDRAGFPVTFMSGFGVSAARLALPDLGLISYAEMVDQLRNICTTVSIPVIGDGDTGFGNAVNVYRTVQGYAAAGAAAIMIEDQVAPKRCGHMKGKEVVTRAEALARVRAATDARDAGADILVLARTDARGPRGFDEALSRCIAFGDLGADIVFLEAPESEAEMEIFCKAVAGPKMANLVEGGVTPIVPRRRLAEMGYALAVYPLTLLLAATGAIQDALAALQRGEVPSGSVDFRRVCDLVGLETIDELAGRYAV